MLAAAKSLSYQAIMKDAPAEDIHTSYPFAISLKEVTSLDKKVVFNSTTDGKVLVPMHPPPWCVACRPRLAFWHRLGWRVSGP